MLYGPFSHFLFFGKSSQGRTFFDVLHRKECYRNFPNGLVHAFWPKLGTFLISCFPANPVKRMLFRQQKSTFKLFAKIGHFSHFLFSSKSSQGRTFFMFQIEKNAFKTTKVNFSTSPKYRNFPKGLVHALRPKMAIVFIGCCWAASLRRLIERALSELDGICLSRGGYTVLYLKFNSQRNSYGYTQGGSSTVCRKTGNEK